MAIQFAIKHLTRKRENRGAISPAVTLKRRFVALLATLSTVALVALPTTATARGSVHVDIPGLSIGIHDDRYKKKRHRRVYKNRHRNNHYNNDHYYDDHRYHKKKYRKKHYHKKRYYNDGYYKKKYHKKRGRYNNHHNGYDNSYDNDYYYGGRSNRYDRRTEICPINGYSPYYNDNLNCYRHKGHFHCS